MENGEDLPVMDWMQKKRKALQRTLLAASLAAAATSLGCAELEGTLAPVDDCTELGEDLRARAMDEMERTLDANLETALSWIQPVEESAEEVASARAELLILPCYELSGTLSPIFMNTALGPVSATSFTWAWAGSVILSADSTTAPTATSGTNNQVAGVAEADFVKNDGEYIYILADGAFHGITFLDLASHAIINSMLALAQSAGGGSQPIINLAITIIVDTIAG